ncbi:unnamed protein product [Urochloa decumbens]|uniref:No apical meristem-associated C-terminal domain-containing protein n=1 Tax=Urochloa decumbens TaxID=240449 RepID=A0ABC9AQ44_9POAL
MAAPLGDGGPAWGTGRDGTRPPPPRLAGLPRLAGPPLPCSISGEGRPPRPAAPTSTSKKRRSIFVAPTRPTAPRPGGDLPHQDLGATPRQVPDGVWPRQVPDDALALGAFVPRQLFEAPPPVARLPSPMRHKRRQEGASHAGSVFTGAGRKAQALSFSEPAQLPSHLVQKRSMEAATTASDTQRTASMTSMQDDDDYLRSSSMPFYDWSPTPTAENNLQNPVGSSSQSYVAMLTQDSEADLEVLTQASIPFVSDSGSSKGRGGNYNHNEGIQLCWSWMAITFDPRIGSDQSKDTYWNRIAQHYHMNKTFDSGRNATSLEKRWNTIQKECIRFQECIEKIERLRPSGVPHTDYFATFVQMKAEEHQKREERWKAEKELEERKLIWDQEQKIMFCDMSNMDESQRAYVMAMRQQIAAAKVASVKASGGCSTSEQGSGGDAEEAESLM